MERRRQTVNQDGTLVREVRRASWSPSQLVAVAAGILLVVIGGVGLARTGTNFSHLAFSHSQVAGLGVTPVSALVELAVGVLILAGGAYPGSAKGTTSVFGVVMLAFGLIVALDAKPFFSNWGYTRGNGIFFIVVGAVLLVTAAASPIFSSRRAVVVQATTSRADVATATQSPPPTSGAQPTAGTAASDDPLQPVQHR